MNITEMKAEARSLAALVDAGTATDEQVAELGTLVSKIEARQAAADLAAKAVAAAAESTSTPAPVVKEDRFAPLRSYTGRGTSEKVEIDTRAITTSDLVSTPTTVNVSTPGFQAPVTSLVNRVPVSTNAVDYVVTTVDNGADFVDEGANKPETTITFDAVSTTLDTVANWVAVTRQALEDGAQLDAIITNAMTNGLARKTEEHIVSTIVAGNENTAGGDNLLAAIRNAIANVEAAGYAPSAIVLNPSDYAAIDLEVLGATVSGPVRGGTVWGCRVVSSNEVTEGTAYVGDFAAAVSLYDRGNVSVYFTDSHEGNFIKNIVHFLAETRIKAAVVAPGAICAASVDVPEVPEV